MNQYTGLIFFEKYNKMDLRGGEVVSCEAHNLETRAHIPAPQQEFCIISEPNIGGRDQKNQEV